MHTSAKKKAKRVVLLRKGSPKSAQVVEGGGTPKQQGWITAVKGCLVPRQLPAEDAGRREMTGRGSAGAGSSEVSSPLAHLASKSLGGWAIGEPRGLGEGWAWLGLP